VFSKVDTLAVFMAWFLPAPRHPRVAVALPETPPVSALSTSGLAGSLARSAPNTAVTLPVPRAEEALIDAADAATTLPENES
jgi:hypothetical protein